MKFKKGDIILNRWAGPNNPTKYFIIRSIRGDKVKVIDFDGKNICIGYENGYSGIYEDYHDGTPAFVKVGESKIFEVIKAELTSFD